MSHLRNNMDLFVYISWKTHEGKPLLADDQIRQAALLAITNRTRTQFCHVLAINATCNQVHVVFRFPASLAVSHIACMAKNAAYQSVSQISDTLCTLRPDSAFLWERQFTSHTLNACEAAEAQTYLQRQISELKERQTVCR